MRDEPYWAQHDPDDDRHIYIYDTNGSDNTEDWTPYAEGDIPEGQTLEEWSEDWHSESASLDNLAYYDEGGGDGEGHGDEDDPLGPGNGDEGSEEETDPAEEPPEDEEGED
ncbi:MAG: hypothetical protein ACOY82_14415, partial [Pseudomonadota bacterium]